LGRALGLLSARAWVPFGEGGARLGFGPRHSFGKPLALVPIGMLLLPMGVLIAKPLALPFGSIAAGLLDGGPVPATLPPGPAWMPQVSPANPPRRRQALETHAAVDAVVVFTLVLIWTVTSRGYFWPISVWLPLATALRV